MLHCTCDYAGSACVIEKGGGAESWLMASYLWLVLPTVLLVFPCRVPVSLSEQCHGDYRGLADFFHAEKVGVCPAAVGTGTTHPVSPPGPQPSAATIPQHLLDFVFLIEYSQRLNKTYLDYFTTCVRKSSSMLEPSVLADGHFTIVIYSLEHVPPAVLYVRHFQTIPGDYDLKREIRQFSDVLETVEHSSQSTVHLSNREIGYMAVDGALQMLNTVLSGELTADVTGKSHSLVPRPQTNLHVVVGLGLFDKANGTSAPTGSVEVIRRTSIEKSIDLILEHSPANTALHFFLPRGLTPAVEFIGSPRHEVRYKDCTHLNKALTLQALLSDASGQAGSLQAHLLAEGKGIHIMDLSALKKVDCIRSISTVLWSGVQFSHTDKCSDGRDRECVSRGGYCSPLHGCVTEPESLDSSTANDKVPLTGTLVMSHADLVKSAPHTQPQSIGKNEVLSITEPPGPTAPAFSLSDIVTGRPRMLQGSPDMEFAERLIKRGKPVVVKNSVVSSWAAMEKWNFSYLANNMGTETLAQVKCTNQYLTFDPDITAPLKLSISLPFTERNMTTLSFFSCVQDPSVCPDGMLGHYYFGSVPQPLQADLNSTRNLYRTERDYKTGRQFLWISSAGMITHGHFDQDYNFFVQLRGTKRFTLWSLSQHELLYMYPRVHPLWHKSQVNFRALDLTRFPDFANSRAEQVVLEPGHVLYVPPYTWHYVETLSPSVSLSTWSHDYDLYDHMNAIYRHDHKFDLIKDPRGIIIHNTFSQAV